MKKHVCLHIGEIYVSKKPVVIDTLVGSCVAVCLFDPNNNIGGMNHILLPGRADMKHFDAPARYGVNAMELLINKMMNTGANRRDILAKVFGGAHLLPAISKENSVGKKNSQFVIEFLKNESIRILSMDMQGRQSRRIFFHTDSGDVFLKRIPSSYYPAIALEEQKIVRCVSRIIKRPAKITFFQKENEWN